MLPILHNSEKGTILPFSHDSRLKLHPISPFVNNVWNPINRDQIHLRLFENSPASDRKGCRQRRSTVKIQIRGQFFKNTTCIYLLAMTKQLLIPKVTAPWNSSNFSTLTISSIIRLCNSGKKIDFSLNSKYDSHKWMCTQLFTDRARFIAVTNYVRKLFSMVVTHSTTLCSMSLSWTRLDIHSPILGVLRNVIFFHRSSWPWLQTCFITFQTNMVL